MPKPPKNPRESSLDLSPGLTCVPKRLPKERLIEAAHRAVRINPANSSMLHRLVGVMPEFSLRDPVRIAAVIGRKWPASGVHLSVGFFGNPSQAARDRIIAHLNAWSAYANVRFSAHAGRVQGAKVRIGFIDEGRDAGYWSWLGTEILEIEADQPTMNLQGFEVEGANSESEYRRVIRHEAGHTLGFPHEHMRRELVAQIDEGKAIEYFGLTQGWTPQEVRDQVLTPLEDSSLLKTPNPDPYSIMCYQIPGTITQTGEPIFGGDDIDEQDGAFAAQLYPREVRRVSEEENAAADFDEEAHRPAAQTGSTMGDDAAVIEILDGMTRITLKRPMSSASETGARAALRAPAAAPQTSQEKRDIVHECIAGCVGHKNFDGDDPLAGIVNGGMRIECIRSRILARTGRNLHVTGSSTEISLAAAL